MNWVIKVKIKNSNICPPVARFFGLVWFFYTSLYKFLFCLPFTACTKHSRTLPFQKHSAEQTEVPRNLYLQELFSGTVGTAYWLQPVYFGLVSLCCSIFCNSNFVEKKKQDNLSKHWYYVRKSCGEVLAGTDTVAWKTWDTGSDGYRVKIRVRGEQKSNSDALRASYCSKN